jgi:hypothetical protein
MYNLLAVMVYIPHNFLPKSRAKNSSFPSTVTNSNKSSRLVRIDYILVGLLFNPVSLCTCLSEIRFEVRLWTVQ